MDVEYVFALCLEHLQSGRLTCPAVAYDCYRWSIIDLGVCLADDGGLIQAVLAAADG